MALYGLENFVFGNVSGSFTTGQTTLNMATGHTARFTVFPMRASLWNFSNSTNPAEAFWDGFTEIIEIVSKSGDTFDEIKRGREGTSAILSDGSEVYRVQPAPTRDQWLKTCRAAADGSSGFDAILEGTAGTVADALARFVKDDGVNDAVVSLQGSPNEGDRMSLWLGDTAAPGNVKLELQKSSSTTDRLTLLMNALPFLTIEGRNRIGIGTAAPTLDAGIDFSRILRFGKLFGLVDGIYTIATGVISTVNTPFVRVSAEGGPGADELETINLEASPGGRALLFLQATTTAHAITVKDATGNIHLSGGDFVMDVDDELLVLIGRNSTNTAFQEVTRIGP